MIGVIDYKMINLGSVLNMLKRVGATDVQVVSGPGDLKGIRKIIMPGVGHFDHAVHNLRRFDLWDALRIKVLEEEVPTLGICLGMQLMAESSEEGVEKGLGFIKGKVRKFSFQDQPLKVPHIGWNEIQLAKASPLFDSEGEKRFYFVHSYFMDLENEEEALCKTEYGHSFVSGFEKNNCIGVQFHPEKSHRYGMKLFEHFLTRY